MTNGASRIVAKNYYRVVRRGIPCGSEGGTTWIIEKWHTQFSQVGHTFKERKELDLQEIWKEEDEVDLGTFLRTASSIIFMTVPFRAEEMLKGPAYLHPLAVKNDAKKAMILMAKDKLPTAPPRCMNTHGHHSSRKCHKTGTKERNIKSQFHHISANISTIHKVGQCVKKDSDTKQKFREKQNL